MGAGAVRADAGLSPALRAAAAIAVMLVVPPAILLISAHTGLMREAIAYPIMFAAWLAGLAGIAFSGWPLVARLILGIAYSVLAVLTLPFLTLLAVCTTGNCL